LSTNISKLGSCSGAPWALQELWSTLEQTLELLEGGGCSGAASEFADEVLLFHSKSHKFEALFCHHRFGDTTAFLSNVIKTSDLNIDILFVRQHYNIFGKHCKTNVSAVQHEQTTFSPVWCKAMLLLLFSVLKCVLASNINVLLS
jgi:hypothetical protein